MFIPEDVLADVTGRYPYDICAAYCVVIVWDLLFSIYYGGFMVQMPSGREGTLFCTFLWWWLWLPVIFSVPGISASFRALQFYQQVRYAERSKITEYILNENCVRTVRLTWSLRKAFVAWNTITLVLLMRPPIDDHMNEEFLSAVWKLSVACAFWTALKKVSFALWFMRLSRISSWCPSVLEYIAPAWTLKSDGMEDSMDNTCMVCLFPFFTPEEILKGHVDAYVRTLPCQCLKKEGRTYHVSCIDQWFHRTRSLRCPVCNMNVEESPITRNLPMYDDF